MGQSPPQPDQHTIGCKKSWITRYGLIGILMVALTGGAYLLGSAGKVSSSIYDAMVAKVNAQDEKVKAQDAELTGLRKKVVNAADLDRELKAKAADLEAREANLKSAEAEKSANQIREGTWTVGRDIQPGTYTAQNITSGKCYWKISRTGTNGSEIIQNDIVKGGRPTVVLSVGQDFTTERCGTWDRN